MRPSRYPHPPQGWQGNNHPPQENGHFSGYPPAGGNYPPRPQQHSPMRPRNPPPNAARYPSQTAYDHQNPYGYRHPGPESHPPPPQPNFSNGDPRQSSFPPSPYGGDNAAPFGNPQNGQQRHPPPYAAPQPQSFPYQQNSQYPQGNFGAQPPNPNGGFQRPPPPGPSASGQGYPANAYHHQPSFPSSASQQSSNSGYSSAPVVPGGMFITDQSVGQGPGTGSSQSQNQMEQLFNAIANEEHEQQFEDYIKKWEDYYTNYREHCRLTCDPKAFQQYHSQFDAYFSYLNHYKSALEQKRNARRARMQPPPPPPPAPEPVHSQHAPPPPPVPANNAASANQTARIQPTFYQSAQSLQPAYQQQPQQPASSFSDPQLSAGNAAPAQQPLRGPLQPESASNQQPAQKVPLLPHPTPSGFPNRAQENSNQSQQEQSGQSRPGPRSWGEAAKVLAEHKQDSHRPNEPVKPKVAAMFGSLNSSGSRNTDTDWNEPDVQGETKPAGKDFSSDDFGERADTRAEKPRNPANDYVPAPQPQRNPEPYPPQPNSDRGFAPMTHQSNDFREAVPLRPPSQDSSLSANLYIDPIEKARFDKLREERLMDELRKMKHLLPNPTAPSEPQRPRSPQSFPTSWSHPVPEPVRDFNDHRRGPLLDTPRSDGRNPPAPGNPQYPNVQEPYVDRYGSRSEEYRPPLNFGSRQNEGRFGDRGDSFRDPYRPEYDQGPERYDAGPSFGPGDSRPEPPQLQPANTNPAGDQADAAGILKQILSLLTNNLQAQKPVGEPVAAPPLDDERLGHTRRLLDALNGNTSLDSILSIVSAVRPEVFAAAAPPAKVDPPFVQNPAPQPIHRVEPSGSNFGSAPPRPNEFSRAPEESKPIPTIGQPIQSLVRPSNIRRIPSVEESSKRMRPSSPERSKSFLSLVVEKNPDIVERFPVRAQTPPRPEPVGFGAPVKQDVMRKLGMDEGQIMNAMDRLNSLSHLLGPGAADQLNGVLRSAVFSGPYNAFQPPGPPPMQPIPPLDPYQAPHLRAQSQFEDAYNRGFRDEPPHYRPEPDRMDSYDRSYRDDPHHHRRESYERRDSRDRDHRDGSSHHRRESSSYENRHESRSSAADYRSSRSSSSRNEDTASGRPNQGFFAKALKNELFPVPSGSGNDNGSSHGRREGGPESKSDSFISDRPSQQGQAELRCSVVALADLLPGNDKRKRKLVVILRGLPGSGKSWIAKRIRDLQPDTRILSLDDLCLVEREVNQIVKGRPVSKKVQIYEYDEKLESKYLAELEKAFKKKIEDPHSSCIVLDAPNEKLVNFMDMVMYASRFGYEVAVGELPLGKPYELERRSTHKRSASDIAGILRCWEPTPTSILRVDLSTLIAEMPSWKPVGASDEEPTKLEIKFNAKPPPLSKWEDEEEEEKLDIKPESVQWVEKSDVKPRSSKESHHHRSSRGHRSRSRSPETRKKR